MRSLIRTLAPAIAVVALLAACGDDDVAVSVTDVTTRTTEEPASTTTTSGPGGGGSQAADLAAARALWDDAGIDDYVIVVEHGCYCLDEYRGPFVVTVVDGRVDTVTDEDGNAVADYVAERQPTIDDLFDEAEEHADQPTLVTLELDPTDGHPVVVSLDPDLDSVDDEGSTRVHSLTPGTATQPADDDEAALAAAEARWAAAGGDDYVADVDVSCGECSIAPNYPVTIVVESGEVVDTFWAVDVDADVLPPGPEEMADFTVEALFDHVRDGLADGQVLDVTYDEVDGHPTVIDDQGFDDVTDDEVLITVSSLSLR
jgi:hypothetical protein